MTFKRLLVWLFEKLVELHLAVAVVLLVTALLPTGAEAYRSLHAFSQAVIDNAHNAREDALYMTRTFMGGSLALYCLKTYLACLYVVGFYAYLSSLYLFTSLLACLFDHKHYALSAVLAFGFSTLVFCLRFVPIFDAAAIRSGVAFFVLGAGLVFGCAVMGEWLMRLGAKPAAKAKPKKAKASMGRRVSLDLGE